MKAFVQAAQTDGKTVRKHLLIVEVKFVVPVRIRRRALWMLIAAAPVAMLEHAGLALMV